ncbi:MAG: penicillin-binding protein 1C [Bdellovibrionales bacterium]
MFSLLKRRKGLFALGILFCFWWGGRWISPPILESVSFSKEILDREGNLLRLTLSGDEKYRVFTALDQIPAAWIKEVLAQEDRYFFYHPGINPISLLRALKTTYWAGDKRVGASTLTMQLARLRSTRGSKTILGKIYQMVGALRLEVFHSKREILEAYLNLIPFGANIEGVGAASRVLFGRPPQLLGPSEMAQLVRIPQDPSQHTPLAVQAIRKLPFLAPHLVETVLSRLSSARPSQVTLTLDRDLQILAEKKMRSYLASLRDKGVNNGALMITHHETMEVLAMVGSGDFFNDEIGGQINGTVIFRSPGSALKPLVYAMAMDQGLIHPLTLLKDSPSSFGAFDPENFDRKFLGPVSAKEALITSRNVPAIHLTSLLKQPSFYDMLKNLGVKRLREPEHYGLALSLGGAEVTMEDLVKIYALLANGGELRDLHYFLKQKTVRGPTLVSAEAAFMTLNILSENPRSDRPGFDSLIRDAVPTAWKTGTSNGFRDAWTVGLVGPYVVSVWLGNFNNDSNPALVGRDLASPLFFNLADGLRGKITQPPGWTSLVGLNVKKVEVCGISGHLPGPHCRAHKKTWFIPGTSPISKCDIHREVLITKAGQRACDETREGLHREVYEFWPSDLLSLFQAAGLPRRTPPAFMAECKVQETRNFGVPPKIISPRMGVTYSLRVVVGRGEERAEKIPLSAVSDGDVKRLHWFVGSNYIGQSDPAHPLFWVPTPGHHIVRVSDDLGRSDSRPVDVRVTR